MTKDICLLWLWQVIFPLWQTLCYNFTLLYVSLFSRSIIEKNGSDPPRTNPPCILSSLNEKKYIKIALTAPSDERVSPLSSGKAVGFRMYKLRLVFYSLVFKLTDKLFHFLLTKKKNVLQNLLQSEYLFPSSRTA